MDAKGSEPVQELARLLEEQLERKDERIAMLEAELEEARRGQAAEPIHIPEPSGPIKVAPLLLPDLQPQVEAVADRVQEAARTREELVPTEPPKSGTLRLNARELQRQHATIRNGQSRRTQRAGIFVGGVLLVAALGYAVASGVLRRNAVPKQPGPSPHSTKSVTLPPVESVAPAIKPPSIEPAGDDKEGASPTSPPKAGAADAGQAGDTRRHPTKTGSASSTNGHKRSGMARRSARKSPLSSAGKKPSHGKEGVLPSGHIDPGFDEAADRWIDRLPPK